MFSSKKKISILCVLLHCITIANAAKQDLIPFILEIHSDAQSGSVFADELLEKTDKHLNSQLKSKIANATTFDNVSTSIKAYTTEEEVNGAGSSTYSSRVTFTGVITLKEKELNSVELEDFQSNAFTGQAKLDYLDSIRNSQDAFLSSAKNVYLSFAKNAKKAKKGSSTMIIVGVSIGVGLLFAGVGIYCYMRRNSRRGGASNDRNEKSKQSEIPDIEMASTGSVSLQSFGDSVPSKETSDMSSHREFSGSETISTLTKTGGGTRSSQSMKSADTIDVNGSIDMMAWKNMKTSRHQVPFETEVSMISKHSPNKTLDVQVPPMNQSRGRKMMMQTNLLKDLSRGGQISTGSQEADNQRTYLSKETLMNHSQKNGFSEHSARYHDRVHGKKRSRRAGDRSVKFSNSLQTKSRGSTPAEV